MSKETVYYPQYLLGVRPGWQASSKEILFPYAGTIFVAKVPLFGATETHKVALQWACSKTPPVICVKHGKPCRPDVEPFSDPASMHRHFKPYAMSIATLECLGEEKPRRLKIYFCNASVHEHNHHRDNDWTGKMAYVVPLW